MSDSEIDRILSQVARNIRLAKSFLAQGATTDGRRHAARAQALLTVLAHARLVRAAAQMSAAKTS